MSRKKDKTPMLLRFIRWSYPKVERLLPPLAYSFFMQLFFTPINFKTPGKERKAESFSTPFTVMAAGKKIQGYRWGESDKTIMVIHGWAGRATQFRRFIKPLLQAGYQVIGFDGPAHGQSEGVRTNIVEFEEVLRQLYMLYGVPEAIIAHSFGGGVALFAAANGLEVKTLINIASPTMADEIVNTYLQAIGGSDKTKIHFKKEIERRYGKPFEAFTALHLITQIKHPPKLLLVHDKNDREVSPDHPQALNAIYPAAELFITEGLGHTRILKDNLVIQKVVTFIQAHTSSQQAKNAREVVI